MSLLRRRVTAVELVLIVASLIAVWLVTPGLAWSPRAGALLAYAAAVVLGQGLLRDVLRLAIAGRSAAPARRLRCLCAESTIGLAMLGAGTLLLGLGLEEPIQLARGGLVAGLAALLALGFVAKDYVLVLRREEDHGSIAIG